MKGKRNNETNKRNKRKQEKGPRGVSRSEGSKTSSSRVRRFEDFEHHATLQDVTRQMKCLKLEGSKASESLWWLHEGFFFPYRLSMIQNAALLIEMYEDAISPRLFQNLLVNGKNLDNIKTYMANALEVDWAFQ